MAELQQESIASHIFFLNFLKADFVERPKYMQQDVVVYHIS